METIDRSAIITKTIDPSGYVDYAIRCFTCMNEFVPEEEHPEDQRNVVTWIANHECNPE